MSDGGGGGRSKVDKKEMSVFNRGGGAGNVERKTKQDGEQPIGGQISARLNLMATPSKRKKKGKRCEKGKGKRAVERSLRSNKRSEAIGQKPLSKKRE